MEPKKRKRGMSRARVIETVTEMLVSALDHGDDLIVTYETYPDNNKRDLHVLVGQLISPCMLGTLKNKQEIREEDGSRRWTVAWR
jgi:hypothetical protein